MSVLVFCGFDGICTETENKSPNNRVFVSEKETFEHFMGKTRVINIPVLWGKLYIIAINRGIKTNENNTQLPTNTFLTLRMLRQQSKQQFSRAQIIRSESRKEKHTAIGILAQTHKHRDCIYIHTHTHTVPQKESF